MEVRIVSTYYNEALEKQIKSGAIESAPWDQTADIAVSRSERDPHAHLQAPRRGRANQAESLAEITIVEVRLD